LRRKVIVSRLECQFAFENEASGFRGGTDRLCLDQFNAANFLFLKNKLFFSRERWVYVYKMITLSLHQICCGNGYTSASRTVNLT
jgi:hypothetical protein